MPDKINKTAAEAHAATPSDAELDDAILINECGDDARKWAEAFMASRRKNVGMLVNTDFMLGWFANAIEAASTIRCKAVLAAERANQGPDYANDYMQMMDATRREITDLRGAVNGLEPQANAYAYLKQVLDMQRGNQMDRASNGMDVVHRLDEQMAKVQKRIDEDNARLRTKA